MISFSMAKWVISLRVQWASRPTIFIGTLQVAQCKPTGWVNIIPTIHAFNFNYLKNFGLLANEIKTAPYFT